MTQISDIIARQKEILNNSYEKFNNALKKIPLKYIDFETLLCTKANLIILNRNLDRKYTIDNNILPVVKQLYYYLIRDKDNFKGELTKGILLLGKNGVGKTLLISSFCDVRSIIYGNNVSKFHSKMLSEKIKELGMDYFIKRPLFIDDIGKESRETMDYGNKILPIADILAFRYDVGALTFATSNYNMNTLTEYYGLTTTDRMKEMFNIIELKGESFRK